MWMITCKLCPFHSGTDLVEAQEHLMEEHGIAQEDFRELDREEVAFMAHYRWRYCGDDTVLLEAVKQSEEQGS